MINKIYDNFIIILIFEIIDMNLLLSYDLFMVIKIMIWAQKYDYSILD